MKEMESLYGEAEGGGEMEHSPEKPEKSKESGHTELVSKKLLGIGEDEQPEPGTEFVLELVKVHGDQAEVKYASKEGHESEHKGMSEDEQLSALAE